MLRAGGNAFDAAVAAGFAAGVAEPVLSSLGGGGFLLARTAAGDELLFDFFVDTPGRGVDAEVVPRLTPVTLRFGSATQVFHVGHGSVAVPGCLAGYLHVHRRLGRLDLADVVAPAQRLAAEGVVIGPDQAATVRLVEAILTLTEAGRRRFRPNDLPLADDAVLVNPQLAALLADVAAGRVESFASGHLGAAIENDNRAGGGVLTTADLRGYTVAEREPLVVTYRGARVVTNPPPSFGGTLVGRALGHLEAGGPPSPAGSGAALLRLVAAFEDVTRHHRGATPRAVRGTTQVSICDREGNLASMTTSNGSGSGVHLADTGVLANNIMGEEDLHPGRFEDGAHTAGVRLPPGIRVGSMMAPSILDRPGAPPVVLGSGGSERIRSALTQVVAHLVDERDDVATAVAAPRIHLDGAGVVQAEPGFAPAALAALGAERELNVWGVTDLYFGGTHAVSPSGEHVGDRRRGGVSTTL